MFSPGVEQEILSHHLRVLEVRHLRIEKLPASCFILIHINSENYALLNDSTSPSLSPSPSSSYCCYYYGSF